MSQGYFSYPLADLHRAQDKVLTSDQATPEAIQKVFKSEKDDYTKPTYYFGELNVDYLIDRFHTKSTTDKAREATIMAMFQAGMAHEISKGDRAQTIKAQISRWDEPAFASSGEKAKVAQYLGVDDSAEQSEEAVKVLRGKFKALIHEDRPVTYFKSKLPSEVIQYLPEKAQSLSGAIWTAETATHDPRIPENIAIDVAMVEYLFRKSMFNQLDTMRDIDAHNWLSEQATNFKKATDTTQPKGPNVDVDLFNGDRAKENLSDYVLFLDTAAALRRLTDSRGSQFTNPETQPHKDTRTGRRASFKAW